MSEHNPKYQRWPDGTRVRFTDRARYCMSREYELSRGGKLPTPVGGTDAIYTADSTKDGLYDVILRETGERWGTAWLERVGETPDA